MKTTLLSESWGFGLLVLIEVLIVALFLYLGRKTELLRDSDLNQPDFTKRPYSMAKTQLSFWIVVIVGCFVYLYFKKAEFNDVINATALVLLGLSTATTALSAIARGPTSPPAPAAVPDHAAPAPIHENFLSDIMSDNEGMNVHRVQMLLWTVVFGIIFIHQVWKGEAFPNYDEKIYGLMGISSATYVWFKRSEK